MKSAALLAVLLLTSCMHREVTAYVEVPLSADEEATLRAQLTGIHIWKNTKLKMIDGAEFGPPMPLHLEFKRDGGFIERVYGRPFRSTWELKGRNVVTTAKNAEWQQLRVDSISEHEMLLFSYASSTTYVLVR